jgi:hypothetical protein
MKHNSVGPLRSIPPIRRTLSAVAIVLSIVTAFAAFGVPANTSWTYQGQLQRSGAAYNGTCNFQFRLWDAASAGTQQGNTLPINSVSVVNGLFTVVLDFGDSATGDPLTGDARWLGTSVQCSGDGGFTPLDPRQPITATPYALSLVPGASVTGPLAVFSQGTGVAIKGLGGASGQGVFGEGYNGVVGLTFNPGGAGVYGSAEDGSGNNSAGVYGKSGGAAPAIYGQNTGTGLAGRFTGSVVVEGNLIVQGSLFKNAGSFRIDHPLDPANKFLSHSFVESPDMMNFYNGNVTTDASGSATVTLPDYFAALNRDYRYQLTVLGQFAQAIVSREIAGNSFEIHTDKPGVKVSWQVTGIRQDAYAQANPIVVEESKPAEEKGLYLFPAGFGAGEEKQIGYPSRPATPQTEQKITKKTN